MAAQERPASVVQVAPAFAAAAVVVAARQSVGMEAPVRQEVLATFAS